MKKIKSIKELLRISRKIRISGGKIVFTNGCFDAFHIGHVRYLQEAAKQGDILIVGINSDSSVKKLKGKNRPVVPEKQRVEIITNLFYVDYVCIFNSISPANILNKIKPDIYVKGGDYKKRKIADSCQSVVDSYGGKIYITSLTKNISSSKIVEKCKTSSKKESVVYAYLVADILHIGHLKHLERSKKYGDYLIVGVLTDKATMEKKPRPVIPFRERIETMKAIKYVNEVIPQDTYSPLPNIKKIKPDVLMESDSHKEQPANNYVKSYGGKVVISHYYKPQSSTSIKNKIKKLW